MLNWEELWIDTETGKARIIDCDGDCVHTVFAPISGGVDGNGNIRDKTFLKLFAEIYNAAYQRGCRDGADTAKALIRRSLGIEP